MEITQTLYVTTREEFRQWLEKNHAKKKESWLVIYKKATHTPCIAYDDAVEEAICFGWIDGIMKSLDHEKYVQRFCPRRKGSNWTEINEEKARRLVKEGKMTDAGKAMLPFDFWDDHQDGRA